MRFRLGKPQWELLVVFVVGLFLGFFIGREMPRATYTQGTFNSGSTGSWTVPVGETGSKTVPVGETGAPDKK